MMNVRYPGEQAGMGTLESSLLLMGIAWGGLFLIAKVKDPIIRRELRRLAWAFFVLGMIAFLIYRMSQPYHPWEQNPPTEPPVQIS